MIGEQFSLSAFEAAGSPEAARRLSDELQDAVLRQLHEVIIARWQQILQQLTALGHELRPYREQVPGDLHVRDDSLDEDGYDCKLRLACDVTISAGFRDVRFSKSNSSPDTSDRQ
jgi:hypothetical protein